MSNRNSFFLGLSAALPIWTVVGKGRRRALIAKARLRILSLHFRLYTVSRTNREERKYRREN